MKKLRAYPVSLSPCFASWGHGRCFKDPLWQNHHNISFINILMVRICGPAMVWWWCFVLGFFVLVLVWLVVGFCVLFPAPPHPPPMENAAASSFLKAVRNPQSLLDRKSSGSSQRMLLLFLLTSYSPYLSSVLFSFFASKALCAVFCEPLWARFLPGAFFPPQ